MYDAWGCHKTKIFDNGNPNGRDLDDSDSADLSHIGKLNPFRYRGYYYDTETKLYYLKTRYYDPEVGRFITIDDLQYLDPEHINGLNLYAYCANNPVMNVDPEGTWSWREFWYGLAAVVAVAATVALFAVAAVLTGGMAGVVLMSVAVGMGFGAAIGGASSIKNGTSFAAGILGGAIKGGAIGLAVGFGIATGAGALSIGQALVGLGVSIGINFAAGVADYNIDNKMNHRTTNKRDMLANGAMQALTGLFAFGAGMIIGASGYYNVPGETKMFSLQWLGNIAASQFIKAITYYPFSILFSFLKKMFFGGSR